MDRVTIITTTYYSNNNAGKKRYAKMLGCVKSWHDNLIFDGTLRLHVADDGSGIPHKWDSRQERQGVGASLNTAFKEAFKHSNIAMYIVDDWMLNSTIDINPWVKLLQNNRDIGIVRIGPPHPGLTGEVQMFNEGFAIVLDRHNYAFAMRPALYHKRFFEYYGKFAEGISCWECERIYNEAFCASHGPDIVYALPVPWEHIDTMQLGQLEPIGG